MASPRTRPSPPAGDQEATPLPRMLAGGREAGGSNHHFRVLQIPMNLFEPGGVLERNTGPENRQTVLEAAGEAGIGIFINRALNGIVGHGMLRMADLPAQGTPID